MHIHTIYTILYSIFTTQFRVHLQLKDIIQLQCCWTFHIISTIGEVLPLKEDSWYALHVATLVLYLLQLYILLNVKIYCSRLFYNTACNHARGLVAQPSLSHASFMESTHMQSYLMRSGVGGSW